jgi:hypothetical protein
MPMDLPPNPPAQVVVTQQQNLKFAPGTVEMVRVTPEGDVLVDWTAIEQAAQALDPQLRHMAEGLLAIRNHTWKNLEHPK